MWQLLGVLSFVWIAVLAVAIAAVVLNKNGAGPWVLVTAGAVMYVGVVLLGPLTERHVGTPTRSLS